MRKMTVGRAKIMVFNLNKNGLGWTRFGLTSKKTISKFLKRKK